jgi:DNA-binding transcriptional regulator YiaG
MRHTPCAGKLSYKQLLKEPLMPNLANVLKEEIRRLARKEIRLATTKLQKSLNRCREEIVELRRQASEQAKIFARLKQGAAPSDEPPAEESQGNLRFSTRSVKAQRKRLGLSAADYGKLAGVSALTIYSWESGKTRPRPSHFAALIALRKIGRREALKRLEELPGKPAEPSEESAAPSEE